MYMGAELSDSICSENAGKDLRMQMYPEVLPDKGHSRNRCGTISRTASVRRMPGRISGCRCVRKCFQTKGIPGTDAELQ